MIKTALYIYGANIAKYIQYKGHLQIFIQYFILPVMVPKLMGQGTSSHQISTEEARKGDPNKEYVMVIDLASCRNARKSVDSCQEMHHMTPEDDWIKVFEMNDRLDTSSSWFE